MPSWKKVITSGSNAQLNQITASGFNLVGTGTAELEVDGHITASGNISASGDVYGDEFYVSNKQAIDYASAGNVIKFGSLTTETRIRGAADEGGITIGTAAEQPVTIGGHLTASYNISSSGKIITSELSALGDLTIDADGADILLKDGGTSFGRLKRDSSDFVIKAESNNNDIIFKGQDGGATITALTLDMSEAGKAIFTGNISASGGTSFIDVGGGGYKQQGVNVLNRDDNELILGPDSTWTAIEIGQVGAQTKNISLYGPVTASGDISASGTITAEQVTSTDDIEADGKILIGDRLEHKGDDDTYIAFGADDIDIRAGGSAQMTVTNTAVAVNYLNGTIDFRVDGNSNDNAFFVDGGTEKVGIGTGTPGEALEVIGNISASGVLISSASIKPGLDKLVAYDTSTGQFHTTASSAFMGSGGGGSTNAAGSDTQVQFNDGGTNFGGDAGLVFNKTTNTLTAGAITSSGGMTVGEALTVTGNISASGHIATDSDLKGMSEVSQLLIGHQTPSSNIVKAQISYNADANAPVAMDFLKSRGTLASPTAVTQGDFTGTQRYFGYDGNSYDISAAIRGDIDASVSNGQVPGMLNFLTAPAGSLISRMVIASTGNVGIGGGGEAFTSTSPPPKTLTVAGDISGSGELIIGNIESNTYISASNGTLEISGSGRGQLEVDYRLFDTGSTHLSAAGGAQGDIVKFGGSGTTAGDIYYLKTNGTWAQAIADAGATSTGSLAVALGSNSTTDGMLLKGMVKLDSDPSTGIGNPVFLDDTAAGHARSDAPDTSGDIVRIVGHYYGNSGLIYFNPDNTFIEVA